MNQKPITSKRVQGVSWKNIKSCKNGDFYDFRMKRYKVGRDKYKIGPRYGFWY